MIDEVKAFAVAFWRAMGYRDNFYAAVRQFLIIVAVTAYAVGGIALAQWSDTW